MNLKPYSFIPYMYGKRDWITRKATSKSTRERSLMTSHIKVGRGIQHRPKKGRYRVGQGR